MSATEDLSVDATRGTVRAHWGIGCIWAQQNLRTKVEIAAIESYFADKEDS